MPSASKSGATFAAGCAATASLIFASIVHVPVRSFTLATMFGIEDPCEHPPPAVTAYSSPSRNAISATPFTSGRWLSADGKPLATVVTFPFLSTFTMLAVLPLVYGPPTAMGTCNCGHTSAVLFVPPGPESATYRPPSGPNFSPRGPNSPCATAVVPCGTGGSCASTVDTPATHTNNAVQTGHNIRFNFIGLFPLARTLPQSPPLSRDETSTKL